MAKRILLIAQNSRGATLIATLLIMALLSFIGVAAVMTSSIETKISGNEKSAKDAFYVAESGWSVAQKWLDNQYPAFLGTEQATRFLGESRYTYNVEFEEVRPMPGYSDEFRVYYYKIVSIGANPQGSQSEIEVTATRVYTVGGAVGY